MLSPTVEVIAEFFNVWLQCMVDAAAVTGHDSIYTPTAKELDVLPRLPRSIVAAYRQQLKPTPHDEANAVRAAQANGQLISDKMSESLALTLVPTWNKREHSTVCLVKTMPAKEARQLLNFAKSIKTGVTYLASAATIMATAETFPERKASSSGALMGMVRNARRWFRRRKSRASLAIPFRLLGCGVPVDPCQYKWIS